MGMHPLFAMQSAGVAAHKDIVSPSSIINGIRIGRSNNIGLAAVAKFALITSASPRAMN